MKHINIHEKYFSAIKTQKFHFISIIKYYQALNECQNPIRKSVSESSVIDCAEMTSRRRVSFDPLALLWDASLEGELDLVQKIATQVNISNFLPLAPNSA